MIDTTDGDVIGKPVPAWRRSSRCANGACIESADTGATVLIRDSKLGDDSPILNLDRDTFRTFIDAVKNDRLGPVT